MAEHLLKLPAGDVMADHVAASSYEAQALKCACNVSVSVIDNQAFAHYDETILTVNYEMPLLRPSCLA